MFLFSIAFFALPTHSYSTSASVRALEIDEEELLDEFPSQNVSAIMITSGTYFGVFHCSHTCFVRACSRCMQEVCVSSLMACLTD